MELVHILRWQLSASAGGEILQNLGKGEVPSKQILTIMKQITR